MNGYFRVTPTGATTDLELFAPTDGGTALAIYTVSDFLTSRGIEFNLSTLNTAVEQAATKDTRVTLNRVPAIPLGESADLKVSQDKMEVYMFLYAPTEGAARMGADDIRKFLESRNVKFGYEVETILDIVENPRYCEDILIAKGVAPSDTTDGSIEYLFNTDNSKRPTLLEDGSVDFFHLNNINSCAEGQVLARMKPASKGEPGQSVEGTLIPARDPKVVQFKYGNNIRVSDDGTELIATSNGNVSLVGDQVFVSNSITFEEIGTATGNIDYEGDVVISGNVETNFEVRAKGNVTVNGVVEGAYIEAGGNIIIAKGVNGMGRAKLSAGGNIIAKYMENVEANAGGFISSEAIMHSNISAGGDILVDGRKGVISGGKATSGGCIEVKTLGAEMANDTIVEVGLSPMIKRDIQNLRQEVAEKQKTLASIQPVLSNLAIKVKSGAQLSQEQKLYISKLMQTQNALNTEIESLTARLASLEAVHNIDTAAEVKVKGTVYPGTRVCISDVSMAVKSPAKYCKFVRLRGDVKITSYE